jgi:translation initiation factor 3 subunit L
LAGKEEKELVRELMLLKGNIKTVRWTETPAGSTGGLLNQEEVLGGNICFAVDGSTIGVTEQRRARQFTGRFLAQGLVAKQVLDQREMPERIYWFEI